MPRTRHARAMSANVSGKMCIRDSLGDSTDYAYFFLPVVAAQALTILPWQPVAAARRWTDGPARTSRHVALTFAVSQLGIAVAAGVFHEPHALRAAVLALLVAVWLSVACLLYTSRCV